MSAPARICYIGYPTSLLLQSANAIQTWTTLRELRRLRTETLVLIPRWPGDPSRFGDVGAVQLPRPAIGRLSRLHRTTLLYYLEHSAFALMCVFYLLVERLRGRRHEVVYIRQIVCAAWFAGVFGRLLGVHVVYEAHDWETRNPSRAKEPWALGLLHLLDRVALTRSTAVVSLTEHFLRELELVGWKPQMTAVIPDAFDPTIYQPCDRHAARTRLRLDPDELIVVYAGMTFSHRGLDRLIEAFVAAGIPDARLILVGGRPKEIAGLQAQVARLGASERVVLAGPHSQDVVADYLAAADILAIPDTVTDVTASPLKLFEYMAMARPIISVDLPALREVIDERATRFVRRGDVADLRNALRELAASPERRAEMGREASRQAQPWTYAARAERIARLCGQLVDAGG
ncbi:MAG TPA: glycosyltransferase family 4 protein [Herpetosiphonaceae bacterium]|nr:glycosyltransferase family 4 protein [Herpetosiphonaceae bacterium]